MDFCTAGNVFDLYDCYQGHAGDRIYYFTIKPFCMKKILLLLFPCVLLSFKKLNAQCDLQFSNVEVSLVGDPIVLGPNKCEYRFNASFDIITNSGFKFLFFHSWLLPDYPNPTIFDCGGSSPASDPGTSLQLGTAVDEPGKSFLDIGFINLFGLTLPANTPVDITPNFANIYPHDPGVVLTRPSNSPGLNATVTRIGTSDTIHFEVTNVRIVLNTPCGAPVIVKTDVWGSNANGLDPKAQCYVCGSGQSIDEPQITLQKTCITSPFQYSIGLTTQSSVDLHLVYRIYADDLDGVPEPDGEEDTLLFVSDTVIVNSATSFNSGSVSLPDPFCCTEPWNQWGLYAVITAREFSNSEITPVIEPACAVLPVTLLSFNASRNNSDVLLKWETVSEEKSKGYYIQRNAGNDIWEVLGFVETRAINGSSNSRLNYSFTDITNKAKGITQYRLKQVDIDGKFAYSPIRAVRAGGQKGKTIVYPNPSNDGRVYVVFENKDVNRNVTLMDMNGRVIRQWKNVLNNTLQIENLLAGFYTLRIVDSETGEQVIEKIVIKNR